MTPAQTRALLSALSAELGTMADQVEGLGGLVQDHVGLCPPEARPQAMVQAQAVDALSQTLGELRHLTRSLARDRSVVEALDELSLADLAGRLRAGVLGRPAPDAAPVVGAGEVDLFD